MAVTATWIHKQGYKFNIFYQTKGGFLRAVTRSKDCVLDNAVDHARCLVIKPNDLPKYRGSK